jgi:bacterioferritin
MKSNTIIPLLKKAYAAELETVENYLANSVWLDGLRAQEVVESLAADVTDELGHAQRLAQRLKELGACPPGSLSIATRRPSNPQPTRPICGTSSRARSRPNATRSPPTRRSSPRAKARTR